MLYKYETLPATPIIPDCLFFALEALTDYLHTAAGLDVNSLLLTGKQHMCILQCEDW